MNSTLIKSTIRSILHNKLRFLSVVLVVCLGTGFYVGIKSSAPQISDLANYYFEKNNLADIDITSPIAFTDDDIKSVAKLGSIEKIQKSKYVDALVSTGGNSVIGKNGTELTCRIRSLNVEDAKAFSEGKKPNRFYFNRVELIDGRYPEKSGECLIDAKLCSENDSISVGSVLTLFGDGSGISDSLVTDTLTVVGTVTTPLYISGDCGTTQVGSGTLDTFAFVSAGDFKSDEYNELFIKVSFPGDSDKFSTGYDTRITRLSNKIKSISGDLINLRLLSIKNDYQNKIEDKEKEIAAYEKQSSSDISANQKKIDELTSLCETRSDSLNNLKAEIENEKNSAKVALDSAKASYSSLKASYESNLSEYNSSGSEISGYTEMKKLYDDLNAKHTADTDTLNGLKQDADSAKETLDKANDEVTSAKGSVNSCENKISSLKSEISSLSSEISELEKKSASYSENVNSIKSKISSTQSEIDELNQKAENGTITASERISLNSKKATLKSQNNELESANDKLSEVSSQLSSKKSSLSDKKAQLSSKEKSLPSLKSALSSAENNLTLAEAAHSSAQKSYTTYKTSYDEDSTTLAKYKSSLDKLTAGKTKITTLAETVEKQKTELTNKELAVSKAQIRYTLASRTSLSKLSKAAYDFTCAEEKVKKLKEEAKEFIDFSDQKKADLNADLLSLKNMLQNINDVTWNVTSQTNMPGHKSFISSIESIRSMANVLPVIFLLVAMLTCFVLMLKNVEENRSETGLLKALGYSSVSVTITYVLYAVLAWLIGCFIGTVLGVCFFPRVIYSIYGGDYSVPDIGFAFNPVYISRGMAASLLTTLTACLTASVKETVKNPASLMQEREISYNKRSLVERIPGVWSKFSYGMIILTRAISRNRKRAVIGTLAIACCTALVFSSFAMLGATSNTKNAQYGDGGILNYDIQIVLNASQIPGNSKTINDLENSGKSESALLISKLSYNVTPVSESWTKIDNAQLIIPSDPGEIGRYINLSCKSGNTDLTKGVLVSEKLASDLGFGAGDTVYLTDYKNETFPVPVSGIVKNYIDSYIYISPTLYEQVFSEAPAYKYILCNTKSYIHGIELSNFISDLLEYDEVIGAVSRDSLAASAGLSLAQSLSLSVLFIFSACILAAIVIYTITNINVFERTREIANIKVIGFTDAEILIYISRENIVSALIGIILGLPGGLLLHRILIHWICIGNIIYSEKVSFISFLLTVVTVAAVILVSAFPIVYRIKKINMPETLKRTD